MSRREFNRETRRAALRRSGKRCEAVGPMYGYPAGHRCNADLALGVEFDHVLEDILGGDNSLENCAAICVKCHRLKTAGRIVEIRKADRQRDKHEGSYWRQKRALPGGKRSPWRKKMNGEVVPR